MDQKLDFDSLTETNWSVRNEIIETSGRPHPLWPQNKRLNTPWTTDYMHTGQDRWIQTELVFTLAKNATKPNPLEIILLQTTRKENNWKTEETLARAAVTGDGTDHRVQSLVFMINDASRKGRPSYFHLFSPPKRPPTWTSFQLGWAGKGAGTRLLSLWKNTVQGCYRPAYWT
jgi:hypothetical protein